MPPAEPPIDMSFHVVTYGEAENRSVVGRKKELYIIECTYNCTPHPTPLRRTEDRPQAVKLLALVL